MSTAPEGGKAPIENTVALIGEAYVMLNAADTALKGGGAPPPSPVPAKLKAEAPLLPEPAKSVVETLAQASGKVTTVQLREILGRDVKSQVGEFCQQAIAGRYPMDRNATRDATQADFALLFSPGGKIESLFTQKLAPYVDTSTRPWRFRQVDGAALGGDVGTLPQFQRAAAIKETFLPDRQYAIAAAGVQAGRNGPRPDAVHPRHRRPDREVRRMARRSRPRCSGPARAAAPRCGCRSARPARAAIPAS